MRCPGSVPARHVISNYIKIVKMVIPVPKRVHHDRVAVLSYPTNIYDFTYTVIARQGNSQSEFSATSHGFCHGRWLHWDLVKVILIDSFRSHSFIAPDAPTYKF